MFHINRLTRGGAERVISGLANHFSDIGHPVILVTAYRPEYGEYAISPNVKRISLDGQYTSHPLARWKNDYILAICKLRILCKEYRPKILVSFSLASNTRNLIATAGMPIKRIISVRENPTVGYDDIAKRSVARFLYPFTDGAVFQTEDAMQFFPEKLQKKSVVLFNPVRNHFFITRREINCKNIVAIGRLKHVKNFGMLIRAFAQISDLFPQEKLLIYGQGELREELQSQIDSIGLCSRIRLCGVTNDVPSILKNAKLFVLSSDSEGMPNALMEAMSMGVPVISTDCPCGGPKVLIQDGVSGLLVPVGDTDAMAAAMGKLLSDESFAQRIGNAAKERARDLFYPPNVMREWEHYIGSFIK